MRLLILEKNQNNEATIFRLKIETTIRFVPGASLFGEQLSLYTNYPTDNKNFIRDQYQKLTWNNVDQENYSSAYADLNFKLPGAFKYYFCFKNDDDEIMTGNGYFIVEPIILVGKNEELILDLIQCQTVLSKCLGYFINWKEKLQVSYESGYNAIHFTPIQELGNSKSSYSLKDHKKLNPMFSLENSKTLYDFDSIAELVNFLNKEWKIISITDIVLNHTANETPWLQEHPESAYNLTNSPHLRPAYLLDRVCYHITMDIVSGKWESTGLPKKIDNEDHLNRLREIFKNYYLPIVNIHEMFLINVDKMVEKFEIRLKSYLTGKSNLKAGEAEDYLKVIQNESYKRFNSEVNLESALKIAVSQRKETNNEIWSMQAINNFRQTLHELNGQIYKEIQNHLDSAVENVINAVRYERIDESGPKIPFVSFENPLVAPYFTHIECDDLAKEEQIIFDSSKNKFIMAHNGWVMGDDPLRNFAKKDSNVYLRRELIAWGDCVKLRYGDKYEDSPFLWDYMKEYVLTTAKIFHGIRLDNCHSTPIHVAEYLLDAARQIRPNLFVMAELFTSSEYLDNIFVNKLGINSLIRESFSCPDSHDLGRLLHRFGADPVGAFVFDDKLNKAKTIDKFNFSTIKPLIPLMSHAILYDQTHDNESSFKKRTPYDLLPTAALVSMFCSAIGSNRGYDEIIPHHIHVVNEKRVYAYWIDDEDEKINLKAVSINNGLIKGRKVLNKLHKDLNKNGYREIFVDQIDFDTVAVTRFNPDTLKSVILISKTVFFESSKNNLHVKPLHVQGKIKKIIFEMKLVGKPDKYKVDEFVINGVQDFRVEVQENLKPENCEFIKIDSLPTHNIINFTKLEPGNVLALEVQLEDEYLLAMQNLNELINEFYSENSLLKKIINELTLNDLNYVLFRINQEEIDEGFGNSAYNIPNFKTFNFCGFSSIMFYWQKIKKNNDLGHPICDNLRKGNWLPNYLANRLFNRNSTKNLGSWLKNAFENLEKLPDFLRPKYFDFIVTPLYFSLTEHCYKCTSTFVQNSNKFIKLLVLGTIALVGFNNTSPLPPLSNSIKDPKPTETEIDGVKFPSCEMISAGLPFFSSGYMRNWGRDTFISLRGSLLITGRFNEARYTILGFAGVLRHGLIPNLLDKGLNSRYNCRDAVWWWLQSIKDYCTIVPNGVDILKESVNRIYPTDDSFPVLDQSCKQFLYQTMQEALERHFDGIDFIERNAGKKIDEQMSKEGFHVIAGVCKETGFPFGGNKFNCGTWMDKMGSSEKASNKGVPATPRDGSAVEIVGLCYSVIDWISNLNKNIYPYEAVENKLEKMTFKEWAEKIKLNFEKFFWINHEDKDSLINRKEIYKDTFKSSERWRDYQLRCNFVISMAVAPQLFNKENARKALINYEKVLVSKLGVKTLDPTDWNYNGNYYNSDDSDNFKTSHGFNYHNGPEWLWPLGYYLRARLIFFDLKSDKTKNFILKKLSNHFAFIQETEWFGLPELTNENGTECKDSCTIQAWSHATLLDALFDMNSAFI